jgi:hypothetical protein
METVHRHRRGREIARPDLPICTAQASRPAAHTCRYIALASGNSATNRCGSTEPRDAGQTLRSTTYQRAASKNHGGAKLRGDFHRIAERRGKFRARVAVARKLLTLVYYGRRDGEICALANAA